MRGKEKCKALKEIRKQIAEQNDIEYAVSECTHQGECKGTCPKCEAELRYLERELAVKQGFGKAVAVVGISTSVCTSLTACSPAEAVEDFLWEVGKAVGIVEDTTGIAPAPTNSGGYDTTDVDGMMAMPESTMETLTGDMPLSEPTQIPEPMVSEAPTAPVPEIEGGIAELITPLPEILEGDIEILETPIPETLAGEIPVWEEGRSRRHGENTCFCHRET